MDIVAVSQDTLETYIEVGIASYHQHYLHLWKDENPAPYLENNFRRELVEQDLKNINLNHLLIKDNHEVIGILKIVKNAPVAQYKAEEAMLLEKIYLLASYTGQGLGKKSLQFAIDLATVSGKKVLWLDTMKKGRALDFYLDLGFHIIGEKDLSYPSVLNDQKEMYLLVYEI